MKLPFFPRAPLSLLLENGAVVDADGAPTRPAGEVLISRALCRFQYFQAPIGLSANELANAVRLKAETEAPFKSSGSLILRAPGGAVIWAWDKDLLIEKLSPQLATRALPETLFRGAGEGWRIVAVGEGFEAQYWRSGALVASTWRRRPFTESQWRAFSLGVAQAETAPPDATPPLEYPPLAATSAWRRQRIGAPWTWVRTEQWGRTVAQCGAAVAMFGAGAALHWDQRADHDERVAAELHAQLVADRPSRRAKAQLELINAYQARMPHANVLDVGGAALEKLREFGVDATSWSVNEQQLRLTFPYLRGQTPLREIMSGLEALPSLRGVAINFEPGGEAVIITAAIERQHGP